VGIINLSQDIVIHPVRQNSDIGQVVRKVQQLAEKTGFTEITMEEIKITVNELASNLVVHGAVEGNIFIYPIYRCGESGIALVSSDQGPGIASISSVMADHHSTAGSMGCGLGAIKRLMDEFDIISTPAEDNKNRTDYNCYKGGTIITGRKWCNKNTNKILCEKKFQWGAVSRALPGFKENGDAYYIKETDSRIFAVVIDALGHGPEAEQASLVALSAIRENDEMAFEKLFPYLHNILNPTRGVALTAISLDKVNHSFVHCAVGNVETRLFPNQTNSPVTRSGILGHGNLPSLRIRSYPWPADGTLIIHSDGISGRWGQLPETDVFKHHPLLVSHFLLRNYERPRDDATVLVISEAG
jgi:anti-sigma regulatory factor (Ser/Thr protein kinase)